MNNDYLDPINAEGMPKQVDATLALDFLLAAKTMVRTLAIAIAEATTPDVRALLRTQLTAALALHGEIGALMVNKGWFHPYQLHEQHRLDMTGADTVRKIAGWELFPDDTARRGLFATPDK